VTEAGIGIRAGVDVGTECVKAVIVGDAGTVLGRAVVPTRGYFQECAYEAFSTALDDAGKRDDELTAVCATGFAPHCVLQATMTATETACHALGAFDSVRQPMTLVAIGGRDPHVITVDEGGRRLEARSSRRCAVGIGSFLMFASRHLDVPPTGLEELAAAVDQPVRVSSYCSVFSGSEVLERLREGASREAVALGCMHSIAERILEIGGLAPPLVASGGVVEYFPGVLRALESLTGMRVRTVPDPIFTGALGAALAARRT